jgi:nucleoside 2-deoxyribosyltransferase
MLRKVYISSSSRDADLAHDLAKRLDKSGLKVIAPTPAEGVNELEYISVRIREALRTADEVIMILTKNSVDSQWLLFEMGYATSLGKHVTPLIQGIEPKELPEIIKQMEYVKYADLDQYISKLQQHVKEPSKSAA